MTGTIDFTNYRLTTRRGVDVELDAVFTERDEAVRQLANANRINNEMTEANTRLTRENAQLKATAPAGLAGLRDDLSAAIGNINTVVTRQYHLLADTGSLARAADIRRRQIAKGYDLAHDRRHGRHNILRAARALLQFESGDWPWDIDQYRRLISDPDRIPHVMALLAAAQDVIAAEAIVVDDREDD